MIQVIKKADQFNDIIFGGRFFANKPVYNGQQNVQPYSCLYYWSNGYVVEDCEFGLHPHQGFEIMTFLFEGGIEHYDTATKVWTPLSAGDFQIIQSNSGIRHQERIKKGSRAFQIWLDPNFKQALNLSPGYTDYHIEDFTSQHKEGYAELIYVGEGSKAHTLTPQVSIKKISFETHGEIKIPLDNQVCYTFYALNGSGTISDHRLEKDDAVRIDHTDNISVSFTGELFYIGTPNRLSYQTVWN
ncbi:MAG: pirin family protein [bacterium]